MTDLLSSVPIRRVSRVGVSSIHRFYDTSPISPSGKYVVVTEFDYEDRRPAPGDEATVRVVELNTGHTVYETRTSAWGTQVGAHAQWGASDEQLFFNRMDVEEWRPFGVVVNCFAGSERALAGTVYQVSPDGRTVLSPNLRTIADAQQGYGVTVPPAVERAASVDWEEDGIFETDVATGRCALALSFAQIVESNPEAFRAIRHRSGTFVGFHVKWSPNGSRIMFILRWKPNRSRDNHTKNWLVTTARDYSQISIALGPSRWAGGHHPNWFPDDERIVMNLLFTRGRNRNHKLWYTIDRIARKLRLPRYRARLILRFASFGFDGSDLKPLSTEVRGSGHPTVSPLWNGLLTDAYPWETVADGDGTSPLRGIVFDENVTAREVRVATVPATPVFWGRNKEWRIDPHPAWSRCGRFVTINGLDRGKRAVFVADMAGSISSSGPLCSDGE